MNISYVPKTREKPTSLLEKELEIIQRSKHLYPSLAALTELDYLFAYFFNIKGEIKVRFTINDKIKNSVYRD